MPIDYRRTIGDLAELERRISVAPPDIRRFARALKDAITVLKERDNDEKCSACEEGRHKQCVDWTVAPENRWCTCSCKREPELMIRKDALQFAMDPLSDRKKRW